MHLCDGAKGFMGTSDSLTWKCQDLSWGSPREEGKLSKERCVGYPCSMPLLFATISDS